MCVCVTVDILMKYPMEWKRNEMWKLIYRLKIRCEK